MHHNCMIEIFNILSLAMIPISTKRCN